MHVIVFYFKWLPTGWCREWNEKKFGVVRLLQRWQCGCDWYCVLSVCPEKRFSLLLAHKHRLGWTNIPSNARYVRSYGSSLHRSDIPNNRDNFFHIIGCKLTDQGCVCLIFLSVYTFHELCMIRFCFTHLQTCYCHLLFWFVNDFTKSSDEHFSHDVLSLCQWLFCV